MQTRKFRLLLAACCLLWSLCPSPAWAKAKGPKFAAGLNHTLTIRADGSLWACGYNPLGQLGVGDTYNRLVPTQVGTASDWVAVAAGGDHSLGIRADGTLWAWGYNYYGQLGLGINDSQKNTPQQVVGFSDWVAVAAGQSHSLAIRTDGSLYAWGWNQDGQLGLGGTDYNDKNTPQPLGGNWVAVAAGYGHSLGVLANGILLTWGANSDYQLGRDTTINPRNIPLPVAGSVFTDWVEVAAGQIHSLGRRAGGTLYAWGYNAAGQLGLGNNITPQNTPQLIPGFSDFVAVAAGSNHSLGRRVDGSLWSWGDNGSGQLGLGYPSTYENSPHPVGAARDWVAVAAGGNHSRGMRADGTLWAWGYNYYGQLGLGDIIYRPSPMRLALGRVLAWKAVSAGFNHSLGISADGSLWAWGYNVFGQLGLGDTIDRHLPARVGVYSDWVAVSAGGYHSLGIRADGSLWAWGQHVGQLGLGETYGTFPTPTRVGNDSNWVAVAAGYQFSLGRRADASLWAWGFNSNGQLGLGNTETKSIPTIVPGGFTWVAVSAGNYHSLGIQLNGSLWAWGWNSDGQLGLGNTESKPMPTIVPGSYTWVAVAAGGYHSLAMQPDGSLWGWGKNNNGQAGQVPSSSKLSPIRIGLDSNWVAVDAGGYHSLGPQASGTLYGWGNGGYGQLGPTGGGGTPKLVNSGTDWVAAAAGDNYTLGLRADGSLYACGYNAKGQLGLMDTLNRNTPTLVSVPQPLPALLPLLLGD